MRESAMEVLNCLNIVNSCLNVGGVVNIVGSLKSDLMLKHRDIDLHLYTDEPMVEKSFAFMKEVAKNNAVKDIQYKNLLDTKEECIEWHLWYEAEDKHLWKLDIIHIRKGSYYDGFFESVTDKIIKKLTPRTKETILQIKHELGENSDVPGIQIYYAVLELGITNCTDFTEWSKKNPIRTVLEWMP